MYYYFLCVITQTQNPPDDTEGGGLSFQKVTSSSPVWWGKRPPLAFQRVLFPVVSDLPVPPFFWLLSERRPAPHGPNGTAGLNGEHLGRNKVCEETERAGEGIPCAPVATSPLLLLISSCHPFPEIISQEPVPVVE